jgi:hypothetical protein
MKPSLDLFPEPPTLTGTPSWADIERLAMHYPSAHHVVALVERGDISREHALVSLVYWFATEFSRGFRREIEALQLEVLDTIVKRECGCTVATYVRRRASELKCAEHESGG